MDRLTALKLQIEWGADDALGPEPVDRLRASPLRAPSPPPSPPAAPIVLAATRQAQAAAARPGTPQARAAAAAELAETLDDLRIAVARFDSPLRDTASHTVFGEGPPDARIMVAADVPGSDEDREGRPFVGAPGDYLGRMFASIGIDRAELRLTTIIPWRPPGNRPPTDAEIATCLPFFQRHVALVRPRCLLLVGAAAKLVPPGRPRRSGPAWVEATFPGVGPLPTLTIPLLAAAMKGGNARRDSWAALRLLRRGMDGV